MNVKFALVSACALILAFGTSLAAKPKGNSVEVVVSATGANEEEARNLCFRSAVEQVCGAFVSSGTLVTDDEISYDEIVSYSSGSIASYKMLSSIRQDDGSVYVTMNVVIGVTEFSDMIRNSKPAGISSYSFDPSDIRDMYKLKEQMKQMQLLSEKQVLQHMMDEISSIAPQCYEYSDFNVKQVVNNSNTRLKYIVTARLEPNDAVRKIDRILFSTFDALTKLNMKTLRQEDEGAYMEVRLNMPKYIGLDTETCCNVYLVSGDFLDYVKTVNGILREVIDSTFVIDDIQGDKHYLNRFWYVQESLSHLISGMSYRIELIEDIDKSVKHKFTPLTNRQ